MVKMIKDNLPTEGIEVKSIGHIMPGQEFTVSEELVEKLISKGFRVIRTPKKKEEG